jgi:hypothetical protein
VSGYVARVVGSVLGLAVLAASAAAEPADAAVDPPTCDDGSTTLRGRVTPDREKTYELLPVEVPPGTARIEIGYVWEPVDGGVIDLGVWDSNGTRGPDAFRAWAGSRQGRIDQGTAPLVVAADRNERTVVARPVRPGTWHVELGFAAVEQPLDWRVEVRCVPGPAAEPLPRDRVDPTVVLRGGPAWFAGDFHLHAYHSHPEGPEPDDMVERAVAAGLDIVPVTEYVTPAHWDRLGPAQRAHPEVLIWPGREVITYFGHLIVLSETPSVVEHRVGWEDVTVAGIQRAAVGDGALVSLAHPTIFPPEEFGSACRGCFMEMLDDLDLSSTQLLEVVTEGSVAELGGVAVPNPFVRTAVALWEQLLLRGHRLTAVSGSDDKLGAKYGSTMTMVWAEELSRPAVDRALRLGHAYVRALGRRSPEAELVATAADGTQGIYGDTLVADTAELAITVRGGAGQVLSVRRNGAEVERVPVDADEIVHRVTATRAPDEGPLGTFWGFEVLDTARFPDTEVPTVIANPVFLADRTAPDPVTPSFTAPERTGVAAPANTPDGGMPASEFPWAVAGVITTGSVLVAAAVSWRRRRR